MIKYIIYLMTNTVNGKIYIGQTQQTLKKRIKSHRSDAKRRDYPLSRAIRKYGFDNFKFEILEINYSTKENFIEDCDNSETFWISNKKSHISQGNGYNLTWGGKSYIISEETKQKMSKAQKGRKAWNKGIPISEETRQKLSKIIPHNKGIPMSEERRLKHTATMKATFGGKPGHNKGRPMSEEAKQKLSSSRKGMFSPNKGKPMSEEQKLKLKIANKGKSPPNKGKKRSVVNGKITYS